MSVASNQVRQTRGACEQFGSQQKEPRFNRLGKFTGTKFDERDDTR